MLTLPRETRSRSRELLGRPVGSGDIQQGEELAHRGVDAPGPGHQAPVLDELTNHLVESRDVTRSWAAREFP